MKRRAVVAAASLLCAASPIGVAAQDANPSSIQSLIEQADSLDQPQTIIQLANTHYQTAKRQGDEVAMIVATLYRLKAEQQVAQQNEASWYTQELSKLSSDVKNEALKALIGILLLQEGESDSTVVERLYECIRQLPNDASLLYAPLIELSDELLKAAPTIREYLLHLLAAESIENHPKVAERCYQTLLSSQAEGGFPRMTSELMQLRNEATYVTLQALYLRYHSLPESTALLYRMASASIELSDKQRVELMNHVIERKNPQLEPLRLFLLNEGLSLTIPAQLYIGATTSVEVESRERSNFELSFKQGILTYPATFALKQTPFPFVTKEAIELVSPEMGEYQGVLSFRSHDSLYQATFDLAVSRIASATLSDGERLRIFGVDLQTGQPLKTGRVISNAYHKYEEREPLKLTNGVATLDQKSLSGRYRIVAGSDSLMPLSYLNHYYSPRQSEVRSELQLQCDRPIYQPGETLHFKGILFQEVNAELKTVEGEKLIATLFSPNGEEIAKQTCSSNSFGSFSGNFLLPSGKMNGSYFLQVTNGSTIFQNCSFAVEAYKTPTLLVELKEPQTAYSFDTPFEIAGRASTFSGLALANTMVRYTIEFKKPWWWRLYYRYVPLEEKSLSVEGETMSDHEGAFQIPIDPTALRTLDSSQRFYLITVRAAVTDPKGETQESSLTISIGEEATLLRANLPVTHEKKATLRFTPELSTPQGVRQEGAGRYELRSKVDNSLQNSGSFTAWKPIEIETNKMSSGNYSLQLFTEGISLVGDTLPQTVLIFDQSSRQMPVDSTSLLIPLKSSCSVGEKGSFLFGTSYEKVWVRYTHYIGTRCHEERWMELRKGVHRFDVATGKAGELSRVILFFAKEGKFYTEEFAAEVSRPVDSLSLKLTTFRDKLRPGSSETWHVEIAAQSGNHPKAELAAWMYDSALEQLIQSYDGFSQPTLQPRSAYYNLQAGSSFGQSNLKLWPWSRNPSNGNSFYPSLNLHGYQPLWNGGGMILYDRMDVTERMEMGIAPSKARSLAKESSDNAAPIAPIRSNFAQTAFFYPAITPDSIGRASFSFTLPDALTTWKLRLVAHTEDMRLAKLTQEVVAQKELMITPNLPRFFREGDRTVVTASLAFLTEEPSRTEVTMELFDPLTLQVWHTQSQTIEQPQKSSAIQFGLTLPADRQSTGVRFVATAGSFSDGEQRIVAILPNRALRTESYTLRANPGQEERLTVKPLEGNYTLELVKNPAWYAVQALSVIGQTNSPDALSLAANFVANSFGMHLVQSNPTLKSYLKSGQAQLLLRRNEQLKGISIDNTPWRDEANDEAEQLGRMAQLFDLNLTAQLRRESMDQLIALQQLDGGFAWCIGMPSSLWQTTQVVHLIGRLPALNAIEFDERERRVLMNAIAYLDKEIIRIEKEEAAHKSSSATLSTTQIALLEARSHFRDIPLAGELLTIHKSWMERAKKSWMQQSLHQKTKLANLLFEYGFPEVALLITESIRQYGVTSDLYGYHFPSNRSESLRTQVGAMQLFARNEVNEPQRVESMKLWLLAQKQNRIWQTTPETVEAIYALLANGTNLLAPSGEVALYLGDSLQSGRQENYLLSPISSQLITANKGEFRLVNQSTAPTYATLYRQWMAPFASLPAGKESELQVKKELILPKEGLTVGGKVRIRLTVNAARALDFVLLTDSYASCFEPTDPLSGYTFKLRFGRNSSFVGAYREVGKESVRYFIDSLPKGVHTFEYDVWVDRTGEYTTGGATVQSLYAPEWVNHSEGSTFRVD